MREHVLPASAFPPSNIASRRAFEQAARGGVGTGVGRTMAAPPSEDDCTAIPARVCYLE
jgi:hypothetical protein